MLAAAAAAAASSDDAAASPPPSIWTILDMCPAPGSAFDPSPFVTFNDWVNTLVLPAPLVDMLVPLVGRLGLTYIRNLLLGSALYWLVCAAWHYTIYHGPHREANFPGGKGIPSRSTLLNQMTLAQSSMLLYAGLPTMSEELIERGLTRVYYCSAQVGGCWAYVGLTALYLALVEVGIYWMHRTLHTNKFLFKHVHALHHQASPYVVFFFLVPVHYFTHLGMVFFTAIWATNIHDTLHGDTEPIMGSKYHLIHHTHYNRNYGQFFIVCDWLWGTLDDGRGKGTNCKKSM